MAHFKWIPYRHSRIDDDEIRLLILEPEGPEGWASKLRGQLKTFVLTVETGALHKTPLGSGFLDKFSSDSHDAKRQNPEAPQYDALSYTWGADDSGTDFGEDSLIHIFDMVSSKVQGPNHPLAPKQKRELGYMRLSSNLEAALRNFRVELRQPRAPLRLWIDAICIRQDDNHFEKSNQIGKMADIYTEAERVRVWLGQGKEEFANLRNFIKQILTLNNFDRMCDSTENVSEWNALRNLMQSPWFQRRWIVQEIAFARRATVHWGSNVIPWKELASTVQLFVSKRAILRKMFHKASETHHDPDLIGEVEAYGAMNLVDRIDKMLRKSEDGNIMELLLSLETVLTSMSAFSVSKPHDTVYAIMQLSKDARPASDRTFRQEHSHNEQRETRLMDTKQTTNPRLLLPHDEHAVSASPERFSGMRETTLHIDPTMLSSADQWTNDIQIERGRALGRTAEAGTHLAVRSDANVRSRSRGRSPAAAKTIAEKAYRKPRKRFVVDYDQSILKLCTEVIQFVTEESKSLDIIVKPWASDMTPDDRKTAEHDEDKYTYPSWIQPAGQRPFTLTETTTHRKSIRIRADNLAGVQQQGFKTYSASGIVPPERPENVPLINGRILATQGFILDKISKIAEPATNAVIPARWLDLGWHDRKGNDDSLPPEEFWRTLVANRESSTGPIGPPLYWRQACQWTFSQPQALHGNLDTGTLIYNLGISGHVSEPVGEFLQRVRAVIWDRALIRTEFDSASLGFLGLVPKEAQKDDLICILYGCSVPVVLRPKDRRIHATNGSNTRRHNKRKRIEFEDGEDSMTRRPRSSESVGSNASHNALNSERQRSSINNRFNSLGLEEEEPEEYSLIGECYIHGMMDGEAFSQLEKYNLKEKEKLFKIGCAFDCSCRLCSPPATNALFQDDYQ